MMMNSQQVITTTKKALTPFLTKKARPTKACVCCPSFSFVFPPFFEQRNDYTRTQTHHNNTSIKYYLKNNVYLSHTRLVRRVDVFETGDADFNRRFRLVRENLHVGENEGNV